MTDFVIENVTNFDFHNLGHGTKTVATVRVKGNLHYVDISGNTPEEKIRKLSVWRMENCPDAKFDVKLPKRMLKRFEVQVEDS